MQIGIISDTHDDISGVKKAVNVFRKRNIKDILHLGDVVAPPVIKFFEGFKIRGIFGNNDGYKQFLIKTYESIGGEVLGDFGVVEIEGLKIAMYHGEFEDITHSLVKSSKYDIVLSGHMHTAKVEKVDGTLFINPGSAHSYFTNDNDPTVAILDTRSMKAEIVALI